MGRAGPDLNASSKLLIHLKLNFDGVNYKLLNSIEPNKTITTSNRNLQPMNHRNKFNIQYLLLFIKN